MALCVCVCVKMVVEQRDNEDIFLSFVLSFFCFWQARFERAIDIFERRAKGDGREGGREGQREEGGRERGKERGVL